MPWKDHGSAVEGPPESHLHYRSGEEDDCIQSGMPSEAQD